MSRKKKDWSKPKESYNGWVYLLQIELGNQTIFKIGTTGRNALIRALEISKEFYGVLGYLPKIQIIEEVQTHNNYAVEAELLKLTSKHVYKLPCERAVVGDSEFRNMCVNELKGLFKQCLAKDIPAQKSFQIGL